MNPSMKAPAGLSALPSSYSITDKSIPDFEVFLAQLATKFCFDLSAC
jgi:hypothetical protein